MLDIFREIVKCRERGESAALATVIATRGSSPGKEAFRMLVKENGEAIGTVGGGCVEADVWAAAKEALATGRPKLLSFTLTERETDGLACGGQVQIFVEPLIVPTLFILGAGHVGQALSRAAKAVGFRVVVVDDREKFASPERFPEADQVVAGEWQEAFGKLRIGEQSYLVIVTRGHHFDEGALRLASRTPARYVGLIGSKAKIGKIFTRLEAEGVPAAWIAEVHAPIGLDIGAVSAEEIAAAIVAEMILVRRGGTGRPLKEVGRGRRPSPSPLPHGGRG